MQKIFEDEMKLMEECIKMAPKSYWIWLHRVWVTQKMTTNWQREIGLCGKLLAIDDRNCM